MQYAEQEEVIPVYIYIVSNPNMPRNLRASIRKSNRLGGVAYCAIIAIVILYLIPNVVQLVLPSSKVYIISNLVAFIAAAYVIPFRAMLKIDDLLVVTDKRIIALDRRWQKALKPLKGDESLSMHVQRYSTVRDIINARDAKTRETKILTAEKYLKGITTRQAEPPAHA